MNPESPSRLLGPLASSSWSPSRILGREKGSKDPSFAGNECLLSGFSSGPAGTVFIQVDAKSLERSLNVKVDVRSIIFMNVSSFLRCLAPLLREEASFSASAEVREIRKIFRDTKLREDK